ncbi:hypothetical protein [Desulfallas thermosapovorans]|uniref:Uncharacterized protein n=1 Tax=Desulfallas thermosapovorans DSM 6562 TaxID=1121431 RepID=A0A5S4ZQN0_9FIRM|nr:hypothetical protein [Desulfallas thermosapovorans]TYO93925.1 hypothetical protein LX24_02489 [Desulfallas thermosapovorans DSM 6562]
MAEDKRVSMEEARKDDMKHRRQDYAVIVLGLILVGIAKVVA